MNLNNVSALGSIVDALIICNCEMTIGDHTYRAGEPFTYLKQVMATIDSQSVSPSTTVATPTNRGMQMVDAINFVNRLVLSNVGMTSKIKSLFFKTAKDQEMTEWITITDPVMRLEHTDAFGAFIYKNNELLIEGADFTLEDGWLRINDFDDAARYFGSYVHRQDLSTFVVENYPYFTIILYATGNVNGKTSDQRLVFKKVSLMPQTSFTFAPVTQNNVNLVFGILEPDKTVTVKI